MKDRLKGKRKKKNLNTKNKLKMKGNYFGESKDEDEERNRNFTDSQGLSGERTTSLLYVPQKQDGGGKKLKI